MLLAITNRQSDRVPAAPDMSNMIPCRLTGRPFWDTYLNDDPPLWRAYIGAVRHFSIDGWFMYGRVQNAHPLASETTILSRDAQRVVARTVHYTPAGPLDEEMTYYGHCDLAEIKRSFGARIALMGNLHTAEVMLNGTPEEVEQAARRCIDAAGTSGGFIFPTGDQCGRDTPEGNIFIAGGGDPHLWPL